MDLKGSLQDNKMWEVTQNYFKKRVMMAHSLVQKVTHQSRLVVSVLHPTLNLATVILCLAQERWRNNWIRNQKWMEVNNSD